MKEINEKDLLFANGELTTTSDPKIKISLAELLALAKQEQFDITVSSSGNSPQQIKYATNSFSAHFVKVQVNPKTMEVKILEAVTTADAGTIISDNTARSQMLGGLQFAAI